MKGYRPSLENIPAISVALQAPLMQVSTPVRNPVASQMQVALVTAQPVEPMALSAQVCWRAMSLIPVEVFLFNSRDIPHTLEETRGLVKPRDGRERRCRRWQERGNASCQIDGWVRSSWGSRIVERGLRVDLDCLAIAIDRRDLVSVQERMNKVTT